MEGLGDKLKTAAIWTAGFLLLVAIVNGPQEATAIAKEIIGGIKTGVTSVVTFVREVFKEI